MNLITKVTTMVVGLCCCAFFSKAQEISTEISVVPPSPNVSALNKYSEVPVGQYTGVPGISVPIYTIQMQQLSLPISLSYHASGLKVEEYASWVGAGWSLNAGGTVNRSVRGLPDEFLPGLSTTTKGKKGYFFNHKLFKEDQRIEPYWLDVDDAEWNPIVTPSGPVSTPDSLAQGYLDTQPDLYNFSYPGGSGKFVFSRSGEIVRFSKDDTKFIEHPFDGSSLPMAGYLPDAVGYVWILEAPDGTRYKYTKSESTKTYGGCGTVAPENGEPDFGHQSAWHLEEISLNGEWIRFEYVTEEILYPMRASVTEKFKVSGSGSPTNSTCTSTLDSKTQRLSRIYTSNGIEVRFIVPVIDRLDLPGSKYLQRIEVRHGNEEVSFHRLHHDYFGTDKKLKLTSVNRENAGGNQSLPGQTFTYFEDAPFPALDSNSQDFWGFYNGANNGAFILPPFKREEYHVNQGSTVNRDPELSNARIGTLQKMTYPTGGSTSFEFELNRYYEADYLKTYVHEISANGTFIEPDLQTTDPFVINGSTYATITLDGNIGGRLLKLVGNEYVFEPLGNIVGNRNVLTTGTYRLEASSNDGTTHSIKIEYEQVEASSVMAGGLRIKRITTLDPETGDLLKKSYEYSQEGSTESSGRLFAPVILGGDVTTYTPGTIHYVSSSGPAGSSGSGEEEEEEEEEGGIEEEEEQITEHGLVSGCSPEASVSSISVRGVSQLPSTFYHGSHIGYSRVLEYAGDENTTIRGTEYPNGAIVSEFINEVPPHNVGDPFVPTIDLGYKNGKLLRQTVYEYVSDVGNPTGLRPVSQTENVYVEEEFTGEKVFSMSYAQMNSSVCYVVPNSVDYIPNYYELKPTWHYLTETINRQFYDEGDIVNTSAYGYPSSNSMPYFMHDSKEWVDSQGKTYREELTRDADHPALVVKSELKKNNQLVGGNEVSYNGKLPANVSTLVPGDGTYRLIKRYSYTSGLLTLSEDYPQAHIPNAEALGQEKRYLWGYGNSVPVAEIVGYLRRTDPDDDSVIDIIAESGIDLDVLNNPSSDDALRNELAKLRDKHPLDPVLDEVVFPGMLITTFTYKRGVGVTSVTDPNGFTTKYFYDAFNRLVKVVDQDGNILQTNQYHYKGQ